jgi:hypothetical protein
MTTKFQDLVSKTFQDYKERFDIIESHPIKVTCYEYNTLYAYFLLKSKASFKVPLSITAEPVQESQSTTVNPINEASPLRD